MVAINSSQSSRLQGEIQKELERREWAEPNDNVMAEYITVLLANGNREERVHAEMDDCKPSHTVGLTYNAADGCNGSVVGSDFDSSFLTWLFDKAAEIAAPQSVPIPSSSSAPVAAPAPAPAPAPASSRLLSSALAPLASQADSNKRKLPQGGEEQGNKRGPTGPRSLVDRMGPAHARGGMQVRGVGRGPPNGFRNGSRPQPGQPQAGFGQQMPGGYPAPQFAHGNQEMMAQMMMMQMGMAQMAEMMNKMASERDAAAAQPSTAPPARPSGPVKVPKGTKLGNHAVSSAPPTSTTSPIPTKPSSKALCKFSVGCTNPVCIYSHPSPVADEKTGMVLSEEACENGKNCKDPECIKSHISPAATLGAGAGPSRLLCKFQHCTNPSCAFRHEDAEGNAIPPPALTAAKEGKAPAPAPSSDGEDVEIVGTSGNAMDGVLDDAKSTRTCRFGERCTKVDCKFAHPPSRPTPASKSARASAAGRAFGKSVGSSIGGGMSASKKFGGAPDAKLDPASKPFVPGADLSVTS
ncbi:nuclear polyadenylated RNA-binding protein NAB2, partial [Tremellales sp. Uapishka_1]